MVELTNFNTLDELIDATVPKAIRRGKPMDLGEYTEGFTESGFLAKFKCVCKVLLHSYLQLLLRERRRVIVLCRATAVKPHLLHCAM